MNLVHTFNWGDMINLWHWSSHRNDRIHNIALNQNEIYVFLFLFFFPFNPWLGNNSVALFTSTKWKNGWLALLLQCSDQQMVWFEGVWFSCSNGHSKIYIQYKFVSIFNKISMFISKKGEPVIFYYYMCVAVAQID